MRELSRTSGVGLGILDEPRQQETAREDLQAFLQRLGSDSDVAQIIYATSERAEALDELLAGVEHTRIEANGTHLLQDAP